MSSIPNSSSLNPTLERRSRPCLVDQVCKRLAFAALSRVREGSIRLHEGETQHLFGHAANGDLHTSIVVHRPRFYRAIVLGGTLGAGEAYIDGDWDCNDLTALVRIIARNESVFAGVNSGLARVGSTLARGWHALRRNTRTGSRHNIAAHYDLSNAFYALWLDETMTYSSAVFEGTTFRSLEDRAGRGLSIPLPCRDGVGEVLRPLPLKEGVGGGFPSPLSLRDGAGGGSKPENPNSPSPNSGEQCLRDAQVAKLERICRKLDLQPADTVVEIGTGWGGFALHAAQHHGCRITTTTISEQQHRFAAERFAAAGMNKRVTLLRDDYRDLAGRFDKLVSIEMIEAVGWQYYDTYFRKIAALLKPDGAACIQAITVADRYYEHAKRDVDFIKRYVFPGSCIPSLGAIATSVARASDLTISDVEDLTQHYAHTLRLWLERFRDRVRDVRALGFDDAFIRMWEYYLQYCEAGFHERTIGLHQIVLTKPGWRGQVAR